MRPSFLAATLAAFLLALPSAAAPAVRKAVAHRGPATAWTQRVRTTADGGFLVGNPAAKVKLIEYGSLSCPYCYRVYREAKAPLDARIAAGTVSFEFRPFGVHSADPILHALLRCAGPANFRRFFDGFLGDQPTLAAAYEAWAGANPNTDPNTTPAVRIALARQWGFTAFATRHGLTPASVTACLSDTAAFQAQTMREDVAVGAGINSTPTFLLNGAPLPAQGWADIDRAIAAALG